MVKILDKEDVDLVVDSGDENEVCRVAGMFDKEVGRLLKLLDRDNVDWLVEAEEEDGLCREAGVVDEFEVLGLLVIVRERDSLVEAGDEDEVCRMVGMVDKVLG